MDSATAEEASGYVWAKKPWPPISSHHSTISLIQMRQENV